MNITSASAALLTLFIAGVGCAVGVDPGVPAGAADSEAIATAEAAIRVSDIGLLQAYFGIDNRWDVPDEDGLIYASFNATPGKRINVDLRLLPGTPGSSVGFSLYRIVENGTLLLIRQVGGQGECVAAMMEMSILHDGRCD